MLYSFLPWLFHWFGEIHSTWVSFLTEKQAFILLPRKKEKFLILLKRALKSETLDLVTLQRLGGKCISMSLAVPGARLYTNEINIAIARAMCSSRPVKMSGALRQEIEHWLFLESWNGFLPRRSEKHSHVRLFSDSSSFAWGGVLSPDAININICDYWSPILLELTSPLRKLSPSTMFYSPLGIILETLGWTRLLTTRFCFVLGTGAAPVPIP